MTTTTTTATTTTMMLPRRLSNGSSIVNHQRPSLLLLTLNNNTNTEPTTIGNNNKAMRIEQEKLIAAVLTNQKSSRRELQLNKGSSSRRKLCKQKSSSSRRQLMMREQQQQSTRATTVTAKYGPFQYFWDQHCQTTLKYIQWCQDAGVQDCTLLAFTTEVLEQKEELSALMGTLLPDFYKKLHHHAKEHKYCINFVSTTMVLPLEHQMLCREIEQDTAINGGGGLLLHIGQSFGGQQPQDLLHHALDTITNAGLKSPEKNDEALVHSLCQATRPTLRMMTPSKPSMIYMPIYTAVATT